MDSATIGQSKSIYAVTIKYQKTHMEGGVGGVVGEVDSHDSES